jgi:hypothetical protein
MQLPINEGRTKIYLTLLDVGIGFLQTFIGGLKGGKAPAEIIASVQSALDAIFSHKQDIINKANLEALRG